MRFLIIRHGDPDYAADNLTARGKIEAELLSRRLAETGLTHIYCSPLGRAQATAAPTVAATGLAPVTLDWLREFPAHIKTDYRPDGMCPWEMRPTHWVSIPELFDETAWKTVSPFVESPCPEVYDRVCGELDGLLAAHGCRRNGRLYEVTRENDDCLALFCHFGLGMALIAHLIGLSLPLLWHTVFLSPSSVTEFRMETGRENPGVAAAKCRFIGDISHLYDVGATRDFVPKI